MSGMPTSPMMDEMLIIEPLTGPLFGLLSRMTVNACLVPRNTPSRLTAIKARQSARVVSVGKERAMLVPAQLTAMFNRPKRFLTSAIVPTQFASSTTSRWVYKPVPPWALISRNTRLPAASLRSASTTVAPSRASSRVIASPRPLAAPVTKAILFATRSIF